MAIKVRDAASSALKFVQRAQAAAPDYTAGVQAAGQSWQQNTMAAQQTWGDAITTAVANNQFTKGVQRAGGDKYARNASTKGAQRYPSGVAAAGPTWSGATQPYLTAISNLTLPPRRPKGDPSNLQRVQVITAALRQMKLNA